MSIVIFNILSFTMRSTGTSLLADLHNWPASYYTVSHGICTLRLRLFLFLFTAKSRGAKGSDPSNAELIRRANGQERVRNIMVEEHKELTELERAIADREKLD